MGFVKSEQLTAFPIAKNRVVNSRQQRLMYEDNITNLVRQVVDTDGFLVSVASDSFVVKNQQASTCTVELRNIQFSLYGYYFNLGNSALGAVSNNTQFESVAYNKELTLFASIELTSNFELNGQDETQGTNAGLYTGLDLRLIDLSAQGAKAPDTPFTTGCTLKTIALGTLKVKNDAEYTCEFKPNRTKFNLESFEKSINFIDGKR